MTTPADILSRNVGARYCARARSTGTLITVYDGKKANLDTEGGRWQTVCEEHGFVVAHRTLDIARSWMPVPEDWCEGCREQIEPTK